MLPKRFLFLLLLTLHVLTGAARAVDFTPQDQSRFIGIRSFSQFNVGLSTNANEVILISPVYKAPIAWDELIVSWNCAAPINSWLKVEAQAIFPDHTSRFYTIAVWSSQAAPYVRSSVKDQIDADGRVNTDTLVMNHPGADIQIRLTLTGMAEAIKPQMKFLGLCFCNNHIQVAPLTPDRAVWGKIITTPERAQSSYPEEKGWCSPTSLSMVLNRWGDVLHRQDLMVDVPAVAAGVYDNSYKGTGNWAFNAAYAGAFPGMRAYVTRLSDISELGEWISAGIPVIISAPWHLLAPGRNDTGDGHLVVVVGFTKTGDLVINDPATNLKKGQAVRHIYTRDNVVNAWKQSHNTVYLVYPESGQIPANRYGQWEQP